MSDLQGMADQLTNLIAEGEEVVNGHQWYFNEVLCARGRTVATRMEAAIERIALPGSSYLRTLSQHADQPLLDRLPNALGVAVALRDDITAGWVTSVVELVHAETHSDYLEMAEELLAKGYKDPAAVIAGTSLEVHVRLMCTKHAVDTEMPDGSPKKAETMNADLKKAGVYDGLQHKQITAWMDLRNKAAHGNYTSYDENHVRLLIDGLRFFMLKYPA